MTAFLWVTGVLTVAAGYPVIAGIVYRRLTAAEEAALPEAPPRSPHRKGHGPYSRVSCDGWEDRLHRTYPKSTSWDQFYCRACNAYARALIRKDAAGQRLRVTAWTWPVSWVPPAVRGLFRLGQDVIASKEREKTPAQGGRG